MKLKNCRNCNSTNLFVLFTLGNLAFTGRFPKNNFQRIKKGELSLSICKNCKLVQLGNTFNLKYLYGPNYGYRTGINKTMSNHVNNITRYLSKLILLNYADLQFSMYFEFNRFLFRRTLILIKSWCLLCL